MSVRHDDGGRLFVLRGRWWWVMGKWELFLGRKAQPILYGVTGEDVLDMDDKRARTLECVQPPQETRRWDVGCSDV